MKTAEEKAQRFIDLLPPSCASRKQAIKRNVILLLKEQDRDTRHACAEAVNSSRRVMSQCSTVAYCNGYNDACKNNHDVCMNAKAV